jgi:hypothetical protein
MLIIFPKETNDRSLPKGVVDNLKEVILLLQNKSITMKSGVEEKFFVYSVFKINTSLKRFCFNFSDDPVYEFEVSRSSVSHREYVKPH